MTENMDFLHKGLIIDFARGNILKIAYDGYIMKACHGTTQLSDDQIVCVYGAQRMWQVTNGFVKDLMGAWDGHLAVEMRTLLDYFDMVRMMHKKPNKLYWNSKFTFCGYKILAGVVSFCSHR